MRLNRGRRDCLPCFVANSCRSDLRRLVAASRSNTVVWPSCAIVEAPEFSTASRLAIWVVSSLSVTIYSICEGSELSVSHRPNSRSFVFLAGVWVGRPSEGLWHTSVRESQHLANIAVVVDVDEVVVSGKVGVHLDHTDHFLTGSSPISPNHYD